MSPLPIPSYLICLDKLEVMLTHGTAAYRFSTDLTTLNRANTKQAYISNTTVLEKLADVQNKFKNYHLAFDIIHNSELIGTLLTARTKYYQTDSALVKISLNNKLLYSDSWATKLQQVLTDLNLIVNNFSYLELALDTNENAIDNFYYYFSNENKYYFKDGNRLKNKILIIGEEYRDGTENKSIYVGKTDKVSVIYNKTEEINKSNKQYISSFHQANGLDINKAVYRIELRLKNTALKRYQTFYEHKGDGKKLSQFAYEKLSNKCKQNYSKITVKSEMPISLIDLENSSFLLSLFKELFNIKFKVKDNTNVTRCTSVNFIDFSANQTTIIKTTNMDLTPTRDDNKLKSLIRMNLKQYSKTDTIAFYDAAVSVAKSNSLQEFFDKTLTEMELKRERIDKTDSNSLF